MAVIEQGAEFNITIKQGATFRRIFEVRESDGTTVRPLTGYTGRSQVRNRAGGDLLLTITVDVDGPTGTVTLFASDTDTANLSKGGVYDVELIAGSGEVEELIYGTVTLRKQVTLP